MSDPPSTGSAPPAPTLWSRPTVSWILYDLANTIFSLSILSLYFPPWIVRARGGDDAMLGYVVALSMGAMLLCAPLLGALSDQTPRRMPFLVASTLVCVFFTALLGQGSLGLTLLFFGVANFFFQAGLIFYDALLPEVSTPENRGRVSGVGIGVGYLGSLLGIATGAALLASGQPTERIFPAVALLFLLFALPCFLFVRERPRVGSGLGPAAVGRALRAVRGTARRARHYPDLARFLLGRLFYTDVANTLITFMAIYAVEELRFSDGETQLIAVVSIVAAVVGGIAWGVVVDRVGPKPTLMSVLALWAATLSAAILIPLLGLPGALFYGVGALAGVALAGLWASDRILMLRLSPPRYLGQFYGLYSMVGRFGQIVGPLLWGFVAITLGLGRPAAMFALLVMILIGAAILAPVDGAPRRWRPDEEALLAEATAGRVRQPPRSE